MLVVENRGMNRGKKKCGREEKRSGTVIKVLLAVRRRQRRSCMVWTEGKGESGCVQEQKLNYDADYALLPWLLCVVCLGWLQQVREVGAGRELEQIW